MAFQISRPATAFSNDPSSKKTKRVEDPAHLAFIRKLPSAVSGEYGCEACHIRTGSAVYAKKKTGIAQKPDDAWTLPLTPAEHRTQHSMNEMEFYREHGIDPFWLARMLYENSGNIQAATMLIRKAKGASVLWPAGTAEGD